MSEGCFHPLQRQTPTTFWINSPTLKAAEPAIEAGASGCTCNPSFRQRMTGHPETGAHALAALGRVLDEVADDSEAEAELQRRLEALIIEKFRPFRDRNPWRDGFVGLRGEPIREEDPEAILSEARANRAVAPKVRVKLPCTRAGVAAIETLVAEDTAIHAIEIMSVARTRRAGTTAAAEAGRA